MPIRVSTTGALSFATSSFISSLAPDITDPPPQNTTGLFASLIILAARFKSSSVIFFVNRLIGSGLNGVYSVLLAVTSFVISTSTGPGLPEPAILKAVLIVSASFVTSLTIKLCFVIGVVTPAISIS